MSWLDSVIGGAISAVGNIFGANKSAESSSENADKNIVWQREVLQNRNQWQVEDLKKAGLNPILGAMNTSSAQGSVVDGSDRGVYASALSNSARAFLDWSRAEAEINLLDQQAKTQQVQQMQLASSAKQQEAQAHFINEQSRGVSREQNWLDQNLGKFDTGMSHKMMPSFSPGGIASALENVLLNVQNSAKGRFKFPIKQGDY